MKIGVLGFAHGHVGMYCRRWKEEKCLGIEVAAGWDHDQERLKQAGNLGFVPHRSPESLLAGENTTEIVAENGVIVHNYGDGPSSGIPRPQGSSATKWCMRGAKEWECCDPAGPRNQGERINHLAGPLAEFMLGKRAPVATAREGRDVLKMILACYESNEKGKRVTI